MRGDQRGSACQQRGQEVSVVLSPREPLKTRPGLGSTQDGAIPAPWVSLSAVKPITNGKVLREYTAGPLCFGRKDWLQVIDRQSDGWSVPV